jgi:hypothetical protein
MRFSTVLALGLSAALLLIVWQSLALIVAGLTVIFYYALAVGSLILLYIGVMAWRQKETERLRAVDGQYALQRGRLADGTPVLVDMNKSISGVTILHRQTGPVELPPAAGWALQGEYVAKIQQTRSLAAITPGDAAQIKTHGAIQQPRLPANITKLLGKDERPPARLVEPAETTPPALAAPGPQLLRLSDALKQSTPDRWILGQNRETGALATFNPASAVHLGIIGVTGTGKTTATGYLAASEALNSGNHAIWLDPKSGVDWKVYARHGEWHATDCTVFRPQLEMLMAEHQRRHQAIIRAGVNHMSKLPNPPVGVVCFLEEYGALRRDMLRRGMRSDAERVDDILDQLITLSRMTAIHLVFIDQYPEHWSNQVIGGTKTKIVYKLGPGQGAKLEEYKAGGLPDHGRFLYRNVPYDAWHAEAVLPKLLANTRRSTAAPIIIDGVASHMESSVDGSVDGSVGGSVASSVAPSGVTPPPYTVTEPAEPTPDYAEMTRKASQPPGPTDYQAAAAEMIKGDPKTRQIDLINELGIAQGYAHELWHKLHPKGKSYQPPAPPTQPRQTRIPDALHGWREIVEADDPASAEQMEAIRQAIASGKISVG